jgi:hypothetical protein
MNGAAPGPAREIAAALAAEALGVLRFHWGEAYEIDHGRAGWRARRRDGLGGILRAPDPPSLHVMIAADYQLKAVPRDLAAGT